MSKAVAAVAVQSNPFKAVFESVGSFSHLVVDFMYGTPERAKMTYLFAIALCALGVVMGQSQNAVVLQACAA